jgi:hypothetical protein
MRRLVSAVALAAGEARGQPRAAEAAPLPAPRFVRAWGNEGEPRSLVK